MRKIGIGTAFGLAGCVALVAGAIALATGSSDGSTVTQVADSGNGSNGDNASRDPQPRRFFHGRFRRPSAKQILARREEYAKELGEELDKSADEVLEAQRNVFKEHLDEAVKEENLTQKQADRILECYETAKCGPGGFGFGGPHPDGPIGPPPGVPPKAPPPPPEP